MNKIIKKMLTRENVGFTLVELLVVISIIGILATGGLVYYNQARKAARDAKRISDFDELSSALELYVNDYAKYPVNKDQSKIINDVLKVLVDKGYMSKLPQDPLYDDEGECTGDEEIYCYRYISDGKGYVLTTRSEIKKIQEINCPESWIQPDGSETIFGWGSRWIHKCGGGKMSLGLP